MEIVRITLVVFAFALVVILIIAFRFPEDFRRLLQRTSSLQVTTKGFAWDLYRVAVESREGRTPDRAEVDAVFDRLSHGRILWVDDSPSSIRLEAQAMRALGVEIDVVTSNEEAFCI